MEQAHRIVKNALLAFVLISIGFVLGKHNAERDGAAAADPPSPAGRPAEHATSPVRVRITYVHSTYRCATCNTIEKMAREVIEEQFADALADGRIEWQEADFQKDEALAERFGIVASCVVVATVRGETVLDFKRLDDVWSLMEDPPKFSAYISGTVRGYLPAATKGGAR